MEKEWSHQLPYNAYDARRKSESKEDVGLRHHEQSGFAKSFARNSYYIISLH